MNKLLYVCVCVRASFTFFHIPLWWEKWAGFMLWMQIEMESFYNSFQDNLSAIRGSNMKIVI